MSILLEGGSTVLSQRKVRTESTHWRDQQLSERHRAWGWDCPAVDIDFLLVEYDQGQPIAIVEYKLSGTKEVEVNHPSYFALQKLADCTHIPLFLVFYNESWNFIISPLNSIAGSVLKEHGIASGEMLTESDYVSFLYSLRGKIVPNEVSSILNDAKSNKKLTVGDFY